MDRPAAYLWALDRCKIRPANQSFHAVYSTMRSATQQTAARRTVIIDTSVVEERYLGPLLRGDVCRDIDRIVRAGYDPAMLTLSLTEIQDHAKRGAGNAESWAKDQADYPGGLQVLADMIAASVPNVDGFRTAYLWFNTCEEWRYGARVDVQTEVLAWKDRMTQFCVRIERVLSEAGVVFLSPWHTIADPVTANAAASLERDLALHSLLPNEDALWLMFAVLARAAAVITSDRGVLSRGRLSMGYNLDAPSVVHPAQIAAALDDHFQLAVYDAA